MIYGVWDVEPFQGAELQRLFTTERAARSYRDKLAKEDKQGNFVIRPHELFDA